jgi:hypothetical protein
METGRRRTVVFAGAHTRTDAAGAAAIFDDPAHLLRCWDDTAFAARPRPTIEPPAPSRAAARREAP